MADCDRERSVGHGITVTTQPDHPLNDPFSLQIVGITSVACIYLLTYDRPPPILEEEYRSI